MEAEKWHKEATEALQEEGNAGMVLIRTHDWTTAQPVARLVEASERDATEEKARAFIERANADMPRFEKKIRGCKGCPERFRYGVSRDFLLMSSKHSLLSSPCRRSIGVASNGTLSLCKRNGLRFVCMLI